MQIIFNPSEVFIGLDIDKALKDATNRDRMGTEFLDAYRLVSTKTEGGLYICTNSYSEGIDTMLGENQYPALVSQGTLCRLTENQDYVTHPELSVSVKPMVHDIADQANKLIKAYGYTATTDGSQLDKGDFLKPEHKQTCFCIVFDENNSTAKHVTTNIINYIYNSVHGIKKQFHVHAGRDAIELVPLDSNGQAFSKLKGIEGILSQPQHANRKQVIILEDSNKAMLEHLHSTRNAFNIAVGNGLPNGDYIAKRVEDIHQSQRAFINMANVLQQTGIIDLNSWTPNPTQTNPGRRGSPAPRG